MSAKNLKNVVIFTNLEDSAKEQILQLKSNEWLKGTNIHLVHIFHVATNNFEFGLYTFPSEEQKPDKG